MESAKRKMFPLYLDMPVLSMAMMESIPNWIQALAAIFGLAFTGGLGEWWRRKHRAAKKRREEEAKVREALLELPDRMAQFATDMEGMKTHLSSLEVGQEGISAAMMLLSRKVNTIDTRLRFAETVRTIQEEQEGVCSFTADANGLFTDASPALCDLWGITKDEFTLDGKGWLQCIDGNPGASIVWEDWKNSVTNLLPYRSRYIIRSPRTQKRFEVEVTVKRVIAGDDHPITFYGHVRKLRDIPQTISAPRTRAIKGAEVAQ